MYSLVTALPFVTIIEIYHHLIYTTYFPNQETRTLNGYFTLFFKTLECHYIEHRFSSDANNR